MKYLKYYLTEGGYVTPSDIEVNVSYIEDIDEVRYHENNKFLLNDGLMLFPNSINDSNRSKVIGYILDNSGEYSGRNIIMSVNASSSGMFWGNSNYLYGTDVPGLTNYVYDIGSTEPYKDKNGKSNTQIVIDYCNSKSWSLLDASQAFDYVKSFSPGYRNGEWYLPSAGELKLFYDNRTKFRTDCNTAGISTNMNSDTTGAFNFWTSTEYSGGSSWFLNFDDSSPSYRGSKGGSRYVVPFLAID